MYHSHATTNAILQYIYDSQSSIATISTKNHAGSKCIYVLEVFYCSKLAVAVMLGRYRSKSDRDSVLNLLFVFLSARALSMHLINKVANKFVIIILKDIDGVFIFVYS